MGANTIFSLLDRFKDEETSRNYFVKIRWNGNIKCPFCDNNRINHYKNGKRYKCLSCRQNFTVTTKTPIESTKIPLRKWLMAIYLFCDLKKGISSYDLARQLGVTQKTSWFMMHRIRQMLERKNQLLQGIIEVDETYVGGKYKNKHKDKKKPFQSGRAWADKVPVFGMRQRDGKVRSMKVKDVTRNTLQRLIHKNVTADSIIMSDEWKAYNGLDHHFEHYRVEHGKKQYVNGDIHTNTIEGYWSHFKRTVIGTYHFISRKHTDRYCKEFDFRYNQRHNSNAGRLRLLLMGINNKPLPLRRLAA